jgi:hypothetical protein
VALIFKRRDGRKVGSKFHLSTLAAQRHSRQSAASADSKRFQWFAAIKSSFHNEVFLSRR